ncbi:iron-containing alcohol dehydrogenase [Wolbachia pipientis]|uniref:iron-containing alcohol dehydrogenase n=1 Tax=Wolbachia pipientis TaxID=955 RepID=UPI0025A45666|nr:iron-containing alcohol dehydrogenase [Wolbachia pipientis]MDM8335745.1 iron-containing alcohol dehydrogenase [Wolbachia pipientis]
MHYLKQILRQAEQIFIREVTVDHHLADSICEICTQYGNDIFLVADENIAKLLNKNVFNKIINLIIPSNSTASLETVNLVRSKIKSSDSIVAFGSGTVNDICKYASYLEGKDYISFPTAASMNGYSSANASVLVDGYKKSFAAHLPKAIYIDTNIIANAPLRLTLSGFADFMCRSTVQADWLLSHLLFGIEYNELPFTFVHDLEQTLLREYLALAKRSKKVVLLLMEALLISGLGMVISKGSYSASQGEHMIAHAMEMVTKDYSSSLHGEKIAVTAITMANLQEKILSIQNPIIKPTTLNVKHVIECFGNTEFTKILKQKQILQQKIKEISHKEWNNISGLIKQNLLPARRLQKMFEDLSIPHLPEHLGWSKEQYCKVVNLAFATRDRFTFLDLANCIKESEVL